MKSNRIHVSDAASVDIIEQADWYQAQSGKSLADSWERAITSAILKIVKSPSSGTLCSFRSSQLRDVRRTAIAGFRKHLIFYRFSEGEITILRVVHGARDLERLL